MRLSNAGLTLRRSKQPGFLFVRMPKFQSQEGTHETVCCEVFAKSSTQLYCHLLDGWCNCWRLVGQSIGTPRVLEGRVARSRCSINVGLFECNAPESRRQSHEMGIYDGPVSSNIAIQLYDSSSGC